MPLLLEAIVASVYGRLATVDLGERLLPCTALGSLLKDDGALAVGDRVGVEASGDTGIIRQRLPRRNALVRPPAHPTKPPRVVAANIDLLVVMAAFLEPPLQFGLIDRYLLAAAFQKIPVALCINKIDQATSDPEDDPLTPYRKLGPPLWEVSSRTGLGMEALAAQFAGKMVVLAGPSGVGKSSLAQRLIPTYEVRIQEVNALTGKGRHTTSTSVLLIQPGGGFLVDTPGVRSFGLTGITVDALPALHPDFLSYARKCRFEDCAHDEEEGCAVEAAVRKGRIDEGRYERYLAIRASVLAGEG